MEFITASNENGVLTVFLRGRIDPSNAAEVENEINAACEESKPTDVVLDAADLQYISSAGLRIILREKKAHPSLKIINASPDIYEIFEMTGFTEMMTIEKAYRQLSVEGCEVIGQGANGKVYRINEDTIVKVYLNPNSLPEIHRERELARTAFVLGIPTAIPYDVVKVGDSYGSVFELLSAKSFAKLLIEDPANIDYVVNMSVDLLKKIHATVPPAGSMPKIGEEGMKWITFLKDSLPEDLYQKLYKLVSGLPDDPHMIHGDYHIKNVLLQKDEVMLIDMDTLCTGHPVYELAAMYSAYIGYSELDHNIVKDFLGIPREMSEELWSRMLRLYFEGESEEKIKAAEEKAMVLSYIRIMRRSIHKVGLDKEEGKAMYDNALKHLTELAAKLDTLSF